LIIASSPYAKRGVLWETHRRHYGPEGDPQILVAQGASRDFNPSLLASVVDRALERDQAAASAEYLAQFRSDIEGFVSNEVVSACVGDYFEMAPLEQNKYHALVDPSGGSSDSMTLAIAHKEGDMAVVDLIREVRPPFSPETIVDDFCVVLKQYRISKVVGDRYAGEWPREQFRKRGIGYVCCEKPKSDLYRDLLPKLNSGKVVLPKSERLVSQLTGLERKTARSGKDSIDHTPGSHDDIANSVAGAIDLIVLHERSQNTGFGMATYGTVIEEDEEPEPIAREALPLTADQTAAAFLKAWRDGGNREQIVADLRAYRRESGELSTYKICNEAIKEILNNAR
jgi:hypothetical protein